MRSIASKHFMTIFVRFPVSHYTIPMSAHVHYTKRGQTILESSLGFGYIDLYGRRTSRRALMDKGLAVTHRLDVFHGGVQNAHFLFHVILGRPSLLLDQQIIIRRGSVGLSRVICIY